MSDRWYKESLQQVNLCKFVLEETVHDAQCVITAQLQQEPSVIINVKVTDYTPPYPGIVLKLCFWSLLNGTWVRWLQFFARHHLFLPRIRVQYTWVWSVYLYQHGERPNSFNFNMRMLHPSGMHSSTQLASWGPHSNLDKLCWLNAGAAEIPPSSSSTVLELRDLDDKMPTTSRGYRLTSSVSSCSCPVSEMLFQFPITSLTAVDAWLSSLPD